MTATLSPSTSLERLLGTVGEAMTGEVIVLEADTPADIAIQPLEQPRCPGSGPRPWPGGRRGDPARPARARPGGRARPGHRPVPPP